MHVWLQYKGCVFEGMGDRLGICDLVDDALELFYWSNNSDRKSTDMFQVRLNFWIWKTVNNKTVSNNNWWIKSGNGWVSERTVISVTMNRYQVWSRSWATLDDDRWTSVKKSGWVPWNTRRNTLNRKAYGWHLNKIMSFSNVFKDFIQDKGDLIGDFKRILS